jgi:hypothetical protein
MIAGRDGGPVEEKPAREQNEGWVPEFSDVAA